MGIGWGVCFVDNLLIMQKYYLRNNISLIQGANSPLNCMNKNNTIIILLAFVIVGGFVAWLVIKNQNENHTDLSNQIDEQNKELGKLREQANHIGKNFITTPQSLSVPPFLKGFAAHTLTGGIDWKNIVAITSDVPC